MEFYLGENLTQVSVEIQPTLVKAQDTTNDSFTCVLKANNDREPIKPMTPFKVVYDDSTSQVFWIINDSVSIFSLNPPSYKHSLTLVQYRYFLNKKLIRNTVFNQPRQKKQTLYTATTVLQRRFADRFYYALGNYESQNQVWYDDIKVNPHSKVKSIKLKYDIYSIFAEVNLKLKHNEVTDSSLANCNASLRLGTFIKIVDTNNSNYVLWTCNIFEDYDMGNYYELSQSDIDTINNYIAERDSVNLRALYGVVLRDGDSQYIPPVSDPTDTQPQVDSSFLNTLNIEQWTEDEYYTVTLQVRFDVEIYNYTMYDIIDVLLKQYRLTSANRGSKREKLFELPTSNDSGEDLELYNLLTSTYPPDTMNFTQTTWFDALSEIFRFYDAGFKFDENKKIKIEYYNDLKNNVTNNLRFSGLTTSQSEKDYVDRNRVYYQNAIIEMETNHITTRVDGLGVPGQNDYCLLFTKKLYEVNKLEIKISGKFKLFGYDNVDLGDYFYLDLTHFVVNKELWGTLDKVNLGISNDWYLYNAYYQEDTLPFDRGSNKINLATYFNTPYGQQKMVLTKVIQHAWRRFFGIFAKYAGGSWDDPEFSTFENFSQEWHNQDFNVSFIAMNNGTTELPSVNKKYDGEVINNQSQSLIDLNKLGSSVISETLRNGEPILTINCEINEWSNRIQEGDYFVDSQNNRWVANIVNYKILPNGKQQCSIEFSKNFNLTSLRIQSDNQKRLTSISANESTISEENYIDYVYVGLYSENYNISSETIVLNNFVISGLLCKTFGKETHPTYDLYDVDIACVDIPSVTVNQNLKISDSTTISNPIYEMAQIPLIKYGSGNCICLECQFDSPINAGNRLERSSGWFGTDKYISLSTKYTDDDGWADEITLRFYQLTDFGKNNSLGVFPLVYSSSNLLNNCGTLNDLQYYKKPNEIFALNYELCFLSIKLNEVFIGSKFINENNITNPLKIKGKKYYIVYTLPNEDGEYSIMDLKGFGSHKVSITDLYYTRNATTGGLNLGFQTNIGTTTLVKTWAVVDENNDIYFASNHSIRLYSSGTHYHLTFYTRKNKI